MEVDPLHSQMHFSVVSTAEEKKIVGFFGCFFLNSPDRATVDFHMVISTGQINPPEGRSLVSSGT